MSTPKECVTGWQPIETAPRDGTYIILAGPSGYTTTALRCEICHYDAEFRPLESWITYSNGSFLDGGDAPTCWLPLPWNQPKVVKRNRPDADG